MFTTNAATPVTGRSPESDGTRVSASTAAVAAVRQTQANGNFHWADLFLCESVALSRASPPPPPRLAARRELCKQIAVSLQIERARAARSHERAKPPPVH